MGKVIRFRRSARSWLRAIALRLAVLMLLLSGLDVVHDGRLGWPGAVAPDTVASLAEAGRTAGAACKAASRAARDALQRVPSPFSAGLPSDRAPVPAPADADLSGRVTRVIDGDSLQIQVAGAGPVEVRLHGIDAPEWNQPHGRRARWELFRLVGYRRVELTSRTTDTYGRLVATVYRDGHSVNAEMVRRGYAWWYRRYAPSESGLERAEEAARFQRRGLWRDDDPLPPWEWRRRQRKR